MVGTGKHSELKEKDFLKFGGAVAGKLNAGSEAASIIAELPTGAMEPGQAAAIAAGVRLRAYKFDRYKTRKKDGEEAALRVDVSVAVDESCGERKGSNPMPISSMGPDGARTGERAPERALPRGIRPPRRSIAQAWRQCRDSRRQGHDKARMGALLGVAQGST